MDDKTREMTSTYKHTIGKLLENCNEQSKNISMIRKKNFICKLENNGLSKIMILCFSSLQLQGLIYD